MNVALVVYNRPALTARVFAEIRRARPERLFVIADGARSDRQSDNARVADTRKVVEVVDWPCEVHRNYSDTNLGCGRRLPTGLDWVFSNVDDAVILEDDCLPHHDFFPFCQELLGRYREDERIGYISGNNWTRWRMETRYSYHVSKVGGTWGWATWRRSWEMYDDDAKAWPQCKATREHFRLLRNRRWARAFEAGMEEAVQVNSDTWDFKWAFAFILSPMLAVNPAVNLVSNVGFGNDGTHTSGIAIPENMAKTAGLTFPLRHPRIVREYAFERATIRGVLPAECLNYRLRSARYGIMGRLRRVPLLAMMLTAIKRLWLPK